MARTCHSERKAGLLNHLAPGSAGDCIGRDPTKQVGNRLRVADGAEKALHPRSGKRGEEVLQVHPQNYALANVGGGKGLDGSALHKAVHRRMRRNSVQDAGENSPLQVFQTRFGSLNQPYAAVRFCKHAVVIVFESRLWTLVAKSPYVRQPPEFW